MKHQVHYQMTLSAPQLNYLSESKYHKNRMAFFLDLVNSAVLKPTKSQVCSCDETINIGQVEKSEVQLAKDWDCDRKTVSKVIAKMNELGIITTKKSNRTSVHTIHPVAAWIVDNIRIKNPYFRTGYVYNQIREGNFDSTSLMSQLTADNNGASMNSTCDKDSLMVKIQKHSRHYPPSTVLRFSKKGKREIQTIQKQTYQKILYMSILIACNNPFLMGILCKKYHRPTNWLHHLTTGGSLHYSQARND